MNKTLIYIDPGFKVAFGHFTRIGKLIREEATTTKIELMHYVNQDVPQEMADELGVIRKFKNITNYPDFNTTLDGILKDIMKSKNQGEYEVFMYTAHPLHLPIIAFLLNKYSNTTCSLSAHICLFILNPELCQGSKETDEYKTMLNMISRLIELFDPGYLLTVCTDSEKAKQAYSPYFKRKLKVLPMPIESTNLISEIRQTDINNFITICYIAQATRRAGDAFIYHTYKKISNMKVFSKIKFKIKHSPYDYFDEKSNDIHAKFLAETKNITHIKDFLSNEAYENFLADCDIILLPYSRKHYYCKTSGIVVEALLRKKIVIVPEDTWLSDQIKKYGSGETFISDNLDSFVQTVLKVINNFDDYKKETSRNIDEYSDLHSSAHLFSEIGLKNTESKIKTKDDLINNDSYQEIAEELLIESTVLIQDKDIITKDKIIKLKEKDTIIMQKNKLLQQKNELLQQKNELLQQKNELIKQKNNQIEQIKNTLSWKIIAPFRWLEKNIRQAIKKEV